MAVEERTLARSHANSISDTQTFSKAGRRVLAELACNDSPIAGLLPSSSPKSSFKLGSSHGGPPRSRRALLPDAVPSLGESLLRSQVQLLLQKMGSDVRASNAEDAPYLHFGNAMGASPTPLSMPASAASAQLPPATSKMAPLQDAVMDAYIENTQFLLLPDSSKEMCNVASSGIHCYSNSRTGVESTSLEASSSLQISDTPSSMDVFVGRRILNFDDTPCKVSLEEDSSRTFSKGAPDCSSIMLQLEDDEVSQWSVNVNVGSPVDKESLIELSESPANGISFLPGSDEDPSMLCKHVRIMQQMSSSKVQLLWDKDNESKVFEDEKDNKAQGISKQSDFHNKRSKDCSEDDVDEHSCGDQDGDCYRGGECGDLCDMFMDMSFGEVGQGLPKGEGKHVRFLYEDGDDEIAEAVVVRAEEDVSCSGTVIRLKGLPMPSGQHWRFSQDDEYEE